MKSRLPGCIVKLGVAPDRARTKSHTNSPWFFIASVLKKGKGAKAFSLGNGHPMRKFVLEHFKCIKAMGLGGLCCGCEVSGCVPILFVVQKLINLILTWICIGILGCHLHQKCSTLCCSVWTPGGAELPCHQYPSLDATSHKVRYILLLIGCAQLASAGLPPVCSNSFDIIPGAHITRVSLNCPACGTGHLGLAQDTWRHHKRASDCTIQGLTRVSTAGLTQGS